MKDKANMDNNKFNKLTPTYKMYFEVQNKYPDSIVCFEMGKFYEILEKDGLGGHAKKAAQICNLVLTKKNKKDPESPHMAGVPNHVAESYFQKLVDSGESVVVISQKKRGTSKETIKKVEREVEKILSPGINMGSGLEDSDPNYFCSIYTEDNILFGISLIDVSTGEVIVTELLFDELHDFVEKKNPSEILLVSNENNLKFGDKKIVHWFPLKKSIKSLADSGKILENMYDLKNPTSNPTYNLESLDLTHWSNGTLSLANIVNYLSNTEHSKMLLKKMSKPQTIGSKDFLSIPNNGYLSLEIFSLQNGDEGTGTLFHSLNKCKTALGRRKLRSWLQHPLIEEEEINKRHNIVESLIESDLFLEELNKVYDISRLSRKMNLSNLMPHEIVHLYNSLNIADKYIYEDKVANKIFSFKNNKKNKEILSYLKKHIILENAEFAGTKLKPKNQYFQKHSKYFKNIENHYLNHENKEKNVEIILSSLNDLSTSDKFRMEEKGTQYKITTSKTIGIAFISLLEKDIDALSKVMKKKDFIFSDNKFVLDKKDLKSFFQTFESKVAIKNPFIIEQLENSFNSKEIFCRNLNKEWKSFQEEFINLYGEYILDIAEEIAYVDVLSNFAKISQERNYNRVEIVNNSQVIDFKKVRHPVVENSKILQEGFVPNNINLNKKDNIKVIYGANSSGKSTLLKSIASSIIMNQIGCFIPANKGSKVSIFEAILTRMSAFDSLSEGKSTFVMEMTELSQALKYKDKNSLFLFDEIGRGTSVEDGEKIAFGTINYISSFSKNSITLFATHYHNLYNSIKKIDKVSVSHLACFTDEKNNLIFERILKDGPGTGSYGLEVAKSCGIPLELLRVAHNYNKKIENFKKSNYNSSVKDTLCQLCKENPVQETHHIIEQKQGKIKKINQDGHETSINNKKNLVLLCSTCHSKITNKKIHIHKKLHKSNGDVYLEVEELKK